MASLLDTVCLQHDGAKPQVAFVGATLPAGQLVAAAVDKVCMYLCVTCALYRAIHCNKLYHRSPSTPYSGAQLYALCCHHIIGQLDTV